ncbi:MAG: carboxypeptidase-like regulatory domain-containing protein, partial [Ferruginibacter sp.]
MRKILLLLLLFAGSLCYSSKLKAQEKTVTGIVTGENNQRLNSVTVSLKGTSIATQTDNNGYYSVKAIPNQSLIFSFVDYQTREVVIGNRSSIDIQLGLVGKSMQEVVITALGIARNKRALASSTQTVSGTELAESQR